MGNDTSCCPPLTEHIPSSDTTSYSSLPSPNLPLATLKLLDSYLSMFLYSESLSEYSLCYFDWSKLRIFYEDTTFRSVFLKLSWLWFLVCFPPLVLGPGVWLCVRMFLIATFRSFALFLLLGSVDRVDRPPALLKLLSFNKDLIFPPSQALLWVGLSFLHLFLPLGL